MSKRDRLIEATRDLLWERGFEATSPRQILERSGAGQGSLYHHFSGKAELVGIALKQVEDDLHATAEAVFVTDRPPLERIEAYLRLPREALKGCRLGRLACEPATVETPQIRDPLKRYFEYVESEFARALGELQVRGQLSSAADAGALASALLSVVQGGYVIARTSGDPARMENAINGALAMLKLAIDHKE